MLKFLEENGWIWWAILIFSLMSMAYNDGYYAHLD